MKIFDILGTKTNLFKRFNILIKDQPKEVLSSFYHFGRLSLEHLGKLGKAERPGNHFIQHFIQHVFVKYPENHTKQIIQLKSIQKQIIQHIFVKYPSLSLSPFLRMSSISVSLIFVHLDTWW